MADKNWTAAIAGGLIGAVVSIGVVTIAGPKLFGERLVKDTLRAEPEILIELSDLLRDKQYAPMIDANRDIIETPYGSSWKGAENPEIVMVEFFDYACGYCRLTNPDIERLIKEEPGLRVVYRELPVLGPNSVIAAQASLAAAKAGKFKEFHDSLFDSEGPTEESITAALGAAGLTFADIQDPTFRDEIQKNYQLANLLGATATPLFVIGNSVINAAEGYDSYKAAIEAARRAKEDA